jgi:hypothetical protein
MDFRRPLCRSGVSPDIERHTLAVKSPDFMVILPWNITEEVTEQNTALHSKGTKFVTAVPELEIL